MFKQDVLYNKGSFYCPALGVKIIALFIKLFYWEGNVEGGAVVFAGGGDGDFAFVHYNKFFGYIKTEAGAFYPKLFASACAGETLK